MTVQTLIGVNNIAKKPNKIYSGVNNIAKEVKEIYIGDANGIAKKVWPMSSIPDDRYQSLSYLGYSNGSFNFEIPDYIVDYNTRVVCKFKLLQETYPSYGTTYWYHVFSIGQYDTGEGMPVYYSDEQNQSGFYYTIRLNNNQFLFRFEQANWYDDNPNYYKTNLFSTKTENFITNDIYTIDFNNNHKVYVYNNTGYYSIASHNLIGTFEPLHTSFNVFRPEVYGKSRFFLCNSIIYSLKIYDGSTLIKDYVPCYRISDNLAGFYDLLNRVAILSSREYTDFIYSE